MSSPGRSKHFPLEGARRPRGGPSLQKDGLGRMSRQAGHNRRHTERCGKRKEERRLWHRGRGQQRKGDYNGWGQGEESSRGADRGALTLLYESPALTRAEGPRR